MRSLNVFTGMILTVSVDMMEPEYAVKQMTLRAKVVSSIIFAERLGGLKYQPVRTIQNYKPSNIRIINRCPPFCEKIIGTNRNESDEYHRPSCSPLPIHVSKKVIPKVKSARAEITIQTWRLKGDE